MAIELITCAACGVKNTASRTVCLRCGADLRPTQEKEDGEKSLSSKKREPAWSKFRRVTKNLIYEPVGGHFKIKPGFYIVLWFVLSVPASIVIGLILDEVFGLWDDVEGKSFWYSLAGMGLSFILVYMLATKIERGRARFSDALRSIVAITVLSFGSSLPFLPVYILAVSGRYGFLGGVVQIVLAYIAATALVLFLVTLLSWLNDSSPRQEFWKSVKLL